MTTNDNTTAMAFYQRLGLNLFAFYRDGVRALRVLKPSIPLRDGVGVPIAHELEFELLLLQTTSSWAVPPAPPES